MKKAIYGIISFVLTHLGNIRISKLPPFLYYDTVDYKVKGQNVLDIMKKIQKGDIIIRGYDSYLDSSFIPGNCKDKKTGLRTGGWSHGAVYVGNNIVIHAVAEGVSEINLIDFCQCDRIAIFRPNKKYVNSAVKIARKFIGTGYDFLFNYGNNAIYCFELCALCYPNLSIKMVEQSKFFGLIKKNVYLAESMFKSKDLKCVYHYNPKYGIS